MNKATKLISLLLAAILLTCAFSACDRGVHPVPDDKTSSSEQFTPHRFGVDDATVKGVRIGMTPEQVRKILGQPDEELDNPGNTILGHTLDMEYGGLALTFYEVDEGDDLTLGAIYSDSPDVKFVGGLHVGSTKDDVLRAFTYEEDSEPLYFEGTEESMGDYIYGDINGSWFLENKPTDVIECAYINHYEDETEKDYLMEYYYYPPLNWNADKSHYTGEYYRMEFFMDGTDDVVTDIRIEFGVFTD